MVNFRLDGKVALVTGASYGIGFAIALAILFSLTLFQIYKRIKAKDYAPIE